MKIEIEMTAHPTVNGMHYRADLTLMQERDDVTERDKKGDLLAPVAIQHAAEGFYSHGERDDFIEKTIAAFKDIAKHYEETLEPQTETIQL